MNFETDRSNVWPYVIAGSAIGGALGYLFITDSGRKFRRSLTHPDELAENVEQAGNYLDRKARVAAGKVQTIVDRAKESTQDGERAYREAGQRYRMKARQIESKNERVASGIHQTVDRMKSSAATIEHSVLDPVCELGAIYKGVERGLRALFRGRSESTPIPIRERMGS